MLEERYKFKFWDTMAKVMYIPNKDGLYCDGRYGLTDMFEMCESVKMYPIQSIGKYDKNKKLIYEGDIIKITNSSIKSRIGFVGEVIFDRGYLRYDLYNPNTKKSYKFENIQFDDLEVIGGIGSNTKLYEKDKSKKGEYVVYLDGYEWSRCKTEEEALAKVEMYDGDKDCYWEFEEFEDEEE